MDEIKKIIPILSENNASVLLYGEKGSGKSYIASRVHQKKGGNAESFFEVNCKSFALQKNLEVLEAAKGWISGSGSGSDGATAPSPPYATLFINCVNKMPMELQQTLLEFIGESARTARNIKIISSTEENLEEKIRGGEFMEALFCRINSVVINVLPLRQRKDEIPQLLEFYRRLYCKQTGFNYTSYSDSAVALLRDYFFAGNIDELKNLVQHAFIVGEPPLLKASDFMLASGGTESAPAAVNAAPSPSDLLLGDKSLKTALDAFKREYVTQILEENGWNQTKTAKILGIQRTYVIRLINELHIQKK